MIITAKQTNNISVDKYIIDEVTRLAPSGLSIAVDFDSTLAITDGFPNIIAPNGDCFKILEKWRGMGCKIILHTMRTGKYLEQAVAWCANCGFFFDGINVNVDDEPNVKKLYAVFYIDDKALGTPLLHDVKGRVRDHVDWSRIDKRYTNKIKKIIGKINKNAEKI